MVVFTYYNAMFCGKLLIKFLNNSSKTMKGGFWMLNALKFIVLMIITS